MTRKDPRRSEYQAFVHFRSFSLITLMSVIFAVTVFTFYRTSYRFLTHNSHFPFNSLHFSILHLKIKYRWRLLRRYSFRLTTLRAYGFKR